MEESIINIFGTTIRGDFFLVLLTTIFATIIALFQIIVNSQMKGSRKKQENMWSLKRVFTLCCLLTLSSCTQYHSEIGSVTKPYEGRYVLSAHSAYSLDIVENDKVFLQESYNGVVGKKGSQKPIELVQNSETNFILHDRFNFEFSKKNNGIFKSFYVTRNEVNFKKVELLRKEQFLEKIHPISKGHKTKIPELQEFVGNFRRSVSSTSNSYIEITLDKGNLFFKDKDLGSTLSVLMRVSDTKFKSADGVTLLTFSLGERGIYSFLNIKPIKFQPRKFTRSNLLLHEYNNPSKKESYTQKMLDTLKSGEYTFSRFISPARGPVDFAVYLPPNWHEEGSETYPLLFFLHGQEGSEHYFTYTVPSQQLNAWIEQKLIPPFVAVSLRSGWVNGIEEQWSSKRNEIMLTSTEADELRAFCQIHFRAGISPQFTSIHGHSRGARGALHYAMKFPKSFASAVSNAFVSDYAVKEEIQNARSNRDEINNSGILFRMSIGESDDFAHNHGRTATPQMHSILEELEIEHEYEILFGVKHSLREIWNYLLSTNELNGLYELKFHARAWSQKKNRK